MASYLTPPNLQALQTTPVRSLNEQVMSTIGARSQQYVQTLSQIKSGYDSTFDFNLSNESNISALQSEKVAADEQLKKIVKKDLSIGTYNTEAQNIFKPTSINRNFLLDEQLTNKIQTNFQLAQSDLKTKGADHYNIKSIQVLNETMEDWKKDNPTNIESYLNDTLGTTYQPYDPKVDKEYHKQLQDRVKNGKIKIDIPDGQGRIVTQEYVDLNSLQAQEYIRSTRPQQSIVQDQLDARLYANRLRKSAPEEREQLLNSVRGIQKYNVDKQVSFIEAEKHKLDISFHMRPQSEQEEAKSDYESAVSSYNEGIRRAKNMYSDFDDSAYFDPLKKNTAQNQLETITSARTVNGLVDGMGLQNVSRTVKNDTSYWNQKTYDFNVKKFEDEKEYRRQKLALEALKLKAKSGDGSEDDGSNPNVKPAGALSSIGTAGLSDEDKIVYAGEQVQKELRGGVEARESDNIASILGKLKVTVASDTGFGNVDAFTAIDQELAKEGWQNKTFKDILDRVTGGNDKNKNFLKVLINEGSAKVNQGKLFRESTLDKINIQQARTLIKAAMSDPKVFNAAVKKAGIDTGDFNAADEIGYNNSTLAYERKTQESKYGETYRTAAKHAGLPNTDGMTFEQLKNMNSEDYLRSVYKGFESLGVAAQDYPDLKRYFNGEITKEELLKNKKFGKVSYQVIDYSGHTIPVSHPNELFNVVDRYKQKWETYERDLRKGLGSKSTGASNYNTVSYNINPKNTPEDKTFDPNIDFNFTTFSSLINNNITSATVAGKTTDGKVAEKFKRLVQEYPNVVTGFSVYTDGKEQFIIPSITTNKETKAALDDVGLDGNDFTKTRIYLDKTALPTLRIKPQSKSANELSKGKIFGSDLPSGNSVTWYNSGTGSNHDLNYEGSFLMTAMDAATGVFTIKKPTFANFIKSKNLEQATIEKAEEVGKFAHTLDSDAVRVTDILKKYNISFTIGQNLVWKDLPKEVKEELKSNTIQFKNLRID